MADTKAARGRHDEGDKHKQAQAEYLRAGREAEKEREMEDLETRRELMAIESAARAAFAGDVASGRASAPSGSFNKRRPAPPPPKTSSASLDAERARIIEAAQNAATARHRGPSQSQWPIPARTGGKAILDDTEPVVFDDGCVPVGGDNAPIQSAVDVSDNKTFHPYGSWKNVKKKSVETEVDEDGLPKQKVGGKHAEEREKYGIVVNKMKKVVDDEEDDIVSKSDMAGCGVTGKRSLDDATDESFKKVSFKKPKVCCCACNNDTALLAYFSD